MTGWYCHQAWVISLDRFFQEKASSYILADRLVPCSYTFTRRSGLGQGGRVAVTGDYLCTWSELPPTTPEWYFFSILYSGGCPRNTFSPFQSCPKQPLPLVLLITPQDLPYIFGGSNLGNEIDIYVIMKPSALSMHKFINTIQSISVYLIIFFYPFLSNAQKQQSHLLIKHSSSDRTILTNSQLNMLLHL